MKQVLKYYWQMIKKRKWMFFALILVLIFHASLEAYWAIILKNMAEILTQDFSNEGLSQLYWIVGLFVALWTVHLIAWRIFEWIIPYFEVGGMKDLSDIATQKIMKKQYQYFQNEFSGSLVKKVNRFSKNFERFSDWLFFDFLGNIFFLLIGFGILFTSNILLACVVLGWGTLYMIGSSAAFIWKMKFDKKAADEDSVLGGKIADSLSNIFTVKSFAIHKDEQGSIASQSLYWKKKTVISWLLSMLIFGVQHLWVIAIEVLFLWYMVVLWKEGSFEIGTFVLYQTIIMILIYKIWEFGRSMRNMFLSVSEAHECVEIMEKVEEEKDSSLAKHYEITKGEIEFREMEFGYESIDNEQSTTADRLTMDNSKSKNVGVQNFEPEDQNTVHDTPQLKSSNRAQSIVPLREKQRRDTSSPLQENKLFSNFNLTIHSGEKIALVGHSGSGKTTLTNLLFRFFEPQSGGIYFDGTESRDFTYQSLRSQISLVPQHPEMFHRTLRENIALGKDVNDDKIWEALEKAQGYDFAKNLPEGLDTMIGERGVKLSGGEKQRVAIARAFLEDAPIVVLDEATSALDSITESELQKGIFQLIENKTAIVIAHRLSTVLKMDRIIVLENGTIIEEGNHETLLSKKGKYANMWEHQRGGFLGDE